MGVINEIEKKSGVASWSRTQIFFLILVVLVMVSNYVDRMILSILQEPIKNDLQLSDLQLGMISGPAFALLYSAFGIPLARLAERANRVTILSIAMAFWSAMTMLCGLAGSFVQLALARVGVGVGEGACTPSTHSLLSDYFSPRQRGMAMAVLTTSIPIAGIIAPLFGGFVATHYSWRHAFILAGMPGIILAIIFFLVAREPRFAKGDRLGLLPKGERPSFLQDARWLLSNRAFVCQFIASALVGMAISGTTSFTASFLLRQYGFTLTSAGFVMAMSIGGAGLAGTFVGGWAADRFSGKMGRSYAMVPAIGAAISCILFILAYSVSNWAVAALLLIIANFCTDLKNGPSYAIVQNLVPEHMRATAIAVMMLGVVLLGTAIGPMIVGAISDAVAAGAYTGDFAASCKGHGASADTMVKAACAEASAFGIRSALIIMSGVYMLSAIAYFMAARSLKMNLD